MYKKQTIHNTGYSRRNELTERNEIPPECATLITENVQSMFLALLSQSMVDVGGGYDNDRHSYNGFVIRYAMTAVDRSYNSVSLHLLHIQSPSQYLIVYNSVLPISC